MPIRISGAAIRSVSIAIRISPIAVCASRFGSQIAIRPTPAPNPIRFSFGPRSGDKCRIAIEKSDPDRPRSRSTDQTRMDTRLSSPSHTKGRLDGSLNKRPAVCFMKRSATYIREETEQALVVMRQKRIGFQRLSCSSLERAHTSNMAAAAPVIEKTRFSGVNSLLFHFFLLFRARRNKKEGRGSCYR